MGRNYTEGYKDSFLQIVFHICIIILYTYVYIIFDLTQDHIYLRPLLHRVNLQIQ